ncbi:MAG: exopolysaccharide biosynthesis polyprenyl glycosylphosphotransferase [Opitutales bacterium]
MLKNRQEGVIALHCLWMTLLVGAVFNLWLALFDASGYINVEETRVWDYALVFLGATFLSFRAYARWGESMLRLSWGQAFSVTKQQGLRLAVLVLVYALVRGGTEISRAFLVSFITVELLIFFVGNRYLPGFIARRVFKASKVSTVFIGSPHNLERLRNWIDKKSNLGVEPVGIFARDEDLTEEDRQRLPILGDPSEVESYIREHSIAQIILLAQYIPRAQARSIMRTSQQFGCRLQICSDLAEEFHHPMLVNQEGTYTFYTLTEEPLENPVNRYIKRVFDIAFSLPIVAFLLPPLVAMVWWFQRKQAPGSLFYTQPRTGMSKRTFNIIKFRTMFDFKQDGNATSRQATKDDPRVYPFGSFLRKTSLDELPQFINVLLGDMSVAGPRPHLLKHDEEFSRKLRNYYTRHFVKPGITGLAQSKGFRGEISELALLEKRIRYDIEYINEWSILLDFKIVLETVRQIVFPPKTAY